jgi:uncharacterized protein
LLKLVSIVTGTNMNLPLLSLLETRVLGVLVEKERTVPDSYPLTLNSLVSGCNQKNNRDPIISASDEEVQLTIDSLKTHSLIVESSGSRVMRYAHNVGRVLRVPDQCVALLATLMLRGPQTAAELRINGERFHKFADIGVVEGFLEDLATRSAEAGGPLAIKLARQPGAREQRWAHLLSGEVIVEAGVSSYAPGAGSESVSVSEIALLKAQVAQLNQDVAGLREQVATLYRELAIPAPVQGN